MFLNDQNFSKNNTFAPITRFFRTIFDEIYEIYENLRKLLIGCSWTINFPKNNIFAHWKIWFHIIFDSSTKFTKIYDLNCFPTINASPKIIVLHPLEDLSIFDEIYENYWFELFSNDQRFSKNNIFAHWRIWFHNIFDFSTKFTKIYENYCWSRCSRMIYGSLKIILLDPLKDLIVYHLWFLDEIYENYWFELFSNDQRFPKNNTFAFIGGSFHIIFDSSNLRKFTKFTIRFFFLTRRDKSARCADGWFTCINYPETRV